MSGAFSVFEEEGAAPPAAAALPQVVGHTAQLAQLAGLIESGKMPNALLFHGP